MKYFLLAVLFLTSFAVRADEGRYRRIFTSANDKFELKLAAERSLWSLVDKTTGKEIYKLEGNISSMTVLVGDDGQSVVAIDDYSEQDVDKNPEVLLFYRNGEKIKGYKLNELINAKFVSITVSHLMWLYQTKSEFAIKDSKVKLTTFELNDFVFEAESGNLLKKEKNPVLSGDTDYIFGTVKGLGGDNHEIEVQCVISGSAKKGNKISFTSNEYRWEGSNFKEALIIKGGKLIAKKEIFFNNCN